jgi:hypothetical protein
MRVVTVALSMVFALASSGCIGGLQMTRINSEQEKPNNVWVFFSVKDGKEPVAELEAEDFEIYEDGGLVSPHESNQVIQNPEVASVMYTLLLLDLSGSVTESDRIHKLIDSAKSFTKKVGKSQKVAVYAFDGSKELHPVVPFTSHKTSVEGGIDGLANWQPKDPSTNLHGAVVRGLETLHESLSDEDKPLKFGNLVVFSDGADRAARVSRSKMLDEMRKEAYRDYKMYAIGIGDREEMKRAKLGDIGRDGTFVGQDSTNTSDFFETVANRIQGHSKSFYLLSYCTPARAGEHEVRIEVNLEERGSGRLRYEFDAEDFGPPPTCNPEREPNFDLEDVTPDSD